MSRLSDIAARLRRWRLERRFDIRIDPTEPYSINVGVPARRVGERE